MPRKNWLGIHNKEAELGVPHSEMHVWIDWQLNRQAGTCQILNFAYNPRQSRVWQRYPTTLQLGPNHICVILSLRRDTITSVWYFVIMGSHTKYQVSMILSQRRDTLRISNIPNSKKLRNFFPSKHDLKGNFGEFTGNLGTRFPQNIQD